jgi:3-dehydroquinate dehydratase
VRSDLSIRSSIPIAIYSSQSPTMSSSINVLVINGPNLNLLGTREPQTYGYDTLKDVENNCKRVAESLGGTCQAFQSNYEGGIVERIHQAKDEGIDGIVINAGKSAFIPISYIAIMFR